MGGTRRGAFCIYWRQSTFNVSGFVKGFVVEELGGNVSSLLLTPLVWMAGGGG